MLTIFTSNEAIQNLLMKHNDKFEQIIDFIETKEQERLEDDDFKFTQKQRYYVKLDLLYDVIKSFAKFVRSDDTLQFSSISIEKGQIVSFAKFKRNMNTEFSEEYTIQTNAIYASGPIQQLHLRYLVKCSLGTQKSFTNDIAKISNEIKRFTKEHKLQKEIERYELRIQENQLHIEKSLNVTDEQIIEILLDQEKSDYKRFLESKGTFTERFKGIDLTDYAFQNEEQYENWIDSILHDDIEKWKKENINWKQTAVKNSTIELKKLQKKMQAL